MDKGGGEATRVDYWLELAAYDLDTAQAMLAAGRYLYVGFTCHLTIEKTLKAAFVTCRNEVPPFRHNLLYLAEQAGLASELTTAQKDLLDALQPLNIEARYPSYRERIARTLTRERCEALLSQTRELHQWLTQRLRRS